MVLPLADDMLKVDQKQNIPVTNPIMTGTLKSGDLSIIWQRLGTDTIKYNRD